MSLFTDGKVKTKLNSEYTYGIGIYMSSLVHLYIDIYLLVFIGVLLFYLRLWFSCIYDLSEISFPLIILFKYCRFILKSA